MNYPTHPAVNRQSVMFADLAGSTELYERLGDAAALRVVSAVLAKLQQAVQAHGGRVVKTIGDEVMAAFPSAVAAALAACAMMRSLEADMQGMAGRLQLRIGFHHGPVLEAEDGDVFGDTVNTAARLVTLSKPGQIITSGAAVELLPPFLRQSARALPSFPLKGKQQAVAVCELIWGEPEKATVLLGQRDAMTPAGARLVLRHPRGSITLSHARPSARLGRAPENDIVLEDARVSRQHARIELRRDKFVLVDESSNGTYVKFAGRDELFLRREELLLPEGGCLCCGASAQDGQAAGLVYFEPA